MTVECGPAFRYMWTCAYGEFEIPHEVLARSFRLKRFGRENYLDDWCRFQWSKGAR